MTDKERCLESINTLINSIWAEERYLATLLDSILDTATDIHTIGGARKAFLKETHKDYKRTEERLLIYKDNLNILLTNALESKPSVLCEACYGLDSKECLNCKGKKVMIL